MKVLRTAFLGYVLSNQRSKRKYEMDLPVLPIHKVEPKYKLECCRLINEEWKRSETARLRSLDSSSDKLPTSLILLDKDSKKVIGHCKISPIPSIPEGCYVESVVISKELRGRGFGTYLMKKAEEYCRDFLGLKMVYLSTKGQEMFYSKLGYVPCEPISIYGSFKATNNNIRIYESKVLTNRTNFNVNNGNCKTYMCKSII